MRIAQISDLHLTKLSWNPLDLFSKRILGNLNWILTRNSNFSDDRLSLFPNFLKELEIDLLLIGGDLTSTATIKEFKEAKEVIDCFPMKTLKIPGNHDIYTKETERKKLFYQFFENETSSLASSHRLKNNQLEIHAIDDHLWLLAIDTALATSFFSSQGAFTQEHEKTFLEIMEKIPADDRVIVFTHYPFFPQASKRRNLNGNHRLQALLEKFPQIILYLHGHTHRHIIADLQESNLPIVLDSGCFVDHKKGSWNLIDLMDDHCVVTAYQYENKWTPFRKETIKWKRKKNL